MPKKGKARQQISHQPPEEQSRTQRQQRFSEVPASSRREHHRPTNKHYLKNLADYIARRWGEATAQEKIFLVSMMMLAAGASIAFIYFYLPEITKKISEQTKPASN